MKSSSPSGCNQPIAPVFGTIILAGGRGSRLGGVRESRMLLASVSFLDRAVAAGASVASTVVVGDDGGWASEIVSVCEFPRWGGPAAALAAGMSALPVDAATIVVALAVDLANIARAVPVLAAHVEYVGTCEGRIATDEQGRAQPLLAAYQRDALDRRCERLHADGLPSSRGWRTWPTLACFHAVEASARSGPSLDAFDVQLAPLA